MFFDSNNNTIIFGNKEDLREVYNAFKNKNSENLRFLKKSYTNGFLPLRPIDNLSEEEYISILKEKKNKANSKGIKTQDYFGENIISNDDFASLLNNKGEIQVGDSIFKYTEKGLFITHKNDRLLLNNLLSLYAKNVNSKIKTYIPSKTSIPNFNISRVKPCLDQVQKARYIENIYFDDCGGGSGGGGGSNSTNDTPKNTSNYSVCVNTKDDWVDNIFGRTYVCVYYFNSKYKLRTIFAAEDFYFFTDVYAQAKFKKKSWIGWWFSNRSASTVYLLNKKIILKTKRDLRNLFIIPLPYVNINDVKEVFNKVYAYFITHESMIYSYVTNFYNFKNKTETNYITDFDILQTLTSTNTTPHTPVNSVTKPLNTVDFNLKNFFGKKINKAITVNILSLHLNLSNEQIIKISYDLLRNNSNTHVGQNETGAVIFTYQDPRTMEVRAVAYTLYGEKITVHNLAVAKRDFNIPNNFKIDELVFLYKFTENNNTGETNNYIGLKAKYLIDVVYSADLEIESGAKYNGHWGGSKFKVNF